MWDRQDDCGGGSRGRREFVIASKVKDWSGVRIRSEDSYVSIFVLHRRLICRDVDGVFGLSGATCLA